MNTGVEREERRMAAAAGSGTQNTSVTAPPSPREGGGNRRDTPEVGGPTARGGLRRIQGLPELRQGESDRRETETEVSEFENHLYNQDT